MRYVGNTMPIHDAVSKASGQAEYAGDMQLKNMLHMALLFSTVPHGIVKKLDCSKALEVPELWILFTVLIPQRRNITSTIPSSTSR